MRTVKIVGGGLALLLLAIAGVVIFGFIVGESNMKAYCSSVSIGMPIKDVESTAQQNGYRFHPGIETLPGTAAYVSVVTSSMTMGRFVCEVYHDGARVVQARYIHND